MTLTDAQAWNAARRLWALSLHKQLEECSDAERNGAMAFIRALAAEIPDDIAEPEVMFAVFLLWVGGEETLN